MFDLARVVLHRALTVVVGPSGCGKSSVIAAGLVPMFGARNAAPGARRWHVIGPVRAIDAIRSRLWARALPEGNVLVVIDQLEELVTQQIDDAERDALLATLASWLDAGPARVRLVVAVRADFEPQLQDRFVPDRWRRARFLVPAMTQDQLRQTIEAPASARQLYFRPSAIVDRLINEVIQMPGALPLLSFTLSELYLRYFERRGDDRAITEADYEAVGGVTRALTRRASGELDELVKTDRRYAQTARRVLLRMVTTDGGGLARRRVPRAELVFDGDDEHTRVNELVNRFELSRLLVSGSAGAEGEPGVAYVEPAHDALVRGWDRLRQWLTDTQPMLPLLRDVAAAAATWRVHGRDPAYLWHANPRLAVIMQQAPATASHELLNAVEVEFVRASNARRSKRRRDTVVAIAMVMAIITATAIVAWVQRGYARHNQELAEASTAKKRHLLGLAYKEQARRLVVEGRMPQALPYLAAARMQGIDDSALHMLFAEATTNAQSLVLAHEQSVIAAEFSLDGTRIVTQVGSNDGDVVDLWDSSTGSRIAELRVPPGCYALSSHNGSQVVTVEPNLHGELRVWDTVTGQPITPVMVHPGGGIEISLSPDQASIATVNDTELRIWNAVTGDLVLSSTLPARPSSRVASVTFSPDGARVLVTSNDDVVAASFTFTIASAAWSRTQAVPLGTPNANPAIDRTLTFDGPGGLRVWEVRTDRGLEHVLVATHRNELLRSARASLDRDGRWLAVSAGAIVHRWDLETGKELLPVLAHIAEVRSVAFRPDGNAILSASDDGTARIWDAATGQELTQPLVSGDRVRVAAFSPDGNRVVTAGDDNFARVWTVRATISHVLPSDQPAIHMTAVGDAIRVMTRVAVGTLQVYDVTTGKRVGQPLKQRKPVSTVAYSPDGMYAAVVATDMTAQVWDLASGTAVEAKLHLQGGNPAFQSPWRPVRFSADGARVAAAYLTGAQVWDARTGEPEPRLVHPNLVVDVGFTTAGLTTTLDSKSGSGIATAGSSQETTTPRHQSLPRRSALMPTWLRRSTRPKRSRSGMQTAEKRICFRPAMPGMSRVCRSAAMMAAS